MNIKNNSEWEILTPTGWSAFSGIKQTQRNDCIKLIFDNNKQIICTPEHRIKTKNDSFIYAKNALENEIKTQDNSFITKIEKEKKDIFVYDILNVEKNNEFISDNIISHNCAHIEDHLMKDFWASVIPVISSSKKRTTKIFMVSTPKGTGNLFYDIFTKAQRGEDDENMSWHAEEIRWYDVPGRGKLWKQDMVEALHGDKLLFEQEFNCCFLETGDSAIDIDLLNELETKCRPAVQAYEEGHYQVWTEPLENHIYGIGVDVGEGIGKAASVVQVLDFTDLTNIHQVALYTDRYIHPTKFASLINKIGRHYGCPPVIVERNNIGSEVLAILQEVHNYENIVTYNPSGDEINEGRLGVMSHSNTKQNGVMNMRYWLSLNKAVHLYDVGTVQELKTFVRYPNGTWKKKQGDNVFDDRVMSLVWALFLISEENLANKYYDVIETDDNGKPLKLAAYQIKTNGMFKLDPVYQGTPNAPMPSVFKLETDSIFDLENQGWRSLR